MSETASKRGWRRLRWGLPLLLGFVVAAFLQWGIHDERWIPGAASLVRSHLAPVASYGEVIREQTDRIRSRVDEQVASYVDRLQRYVKRMRTEAEAIARVARPPTSTRPPVPASVLAGVPTAEIEADPGMSYEDPLAPLAFLTKRMEEARSAAEAESRRAAAARRQAVALARRVEADAREEPAAPANGSVPTPVHRNGGPKGVARVDLNGDGVAAAGTNGVGHNGNGANGHSGNGNGTSAIGSVVPYPAIVPRPPSGSAGSAIQPAATDSTGRVQPANHTSGPARSGSPVTIGEPMRDVPPSARLLANAGGPGDRGVPRPPGQRVAQSSGAGRVPPPPSAGFADDDGEEPALIGPERAPALESQRLYRAGGVLLPPGRLRIEPALSYSVSDRFRIVTQGLDILDVIFIGSIDSADTRRESLLSTLTFRYGVSPRFNIRGTIPYEWRNVNVIPSSTVDDPLRNNRERTERVSGLGDITMGFSYQLYRSDSRLPNVVGNFNYSLDTGDPGATGRGSDQVSGGLTFMTQSDPAVLFGSVNYLHMMDDFEGFRRGDMVGGSLGFSYALNYDLSLSTTVSFLRQIEDSEFAGAADQSFTARRTMISTLSMGVTYALTNRTVVDLSIGMGLTDDAPEFGFTLSLPMVFNTSNWW